MAVRPQANDEDAPVVVRRLKGQGPRTLLIHGLGANASVYDPCAGLLADGLELWSAQLPWRGEGVGDWGRGPALGHWLERALRLVPGGAEVVVAHSMSANVLLDLLDRESRQGTDPFARFGVRALVLVSPFYRGSTEDFDWQTISYYLNDFHLIMEEGIRVHSGGRLDADIQRAMAHRVRDRVGPYGWLRFFDLYLGTPGLQTGRITVPSLVIGGEHDFAAPPGEGEALAAALPDARVRILPTGHFPMIERPEEFASEIRQFIDSTLADEPQHGAGPRTLLEHH